MVSFWKIILLGFPFCVIVLLLIDPKCLRKCQSWCIQHRKRSANKGATREHMRRTNNSRLATTLSIMLNQCIILTAFRGKEWTTKETMDFVSVIVAVIGRFCGIVSCDIMSSRAPHLNWIAAKDMHDGKMRSFFLQFLRRKESPLKCVLFCLLQMYTPNIFPPDFFFFWLFIWIIPFDFCYCEIFILNSVLTATQTKTSRGTYPSEREKRDTVNRMHTPKNIQCARKYRPHAYGRNRCAGDQRSNGAVDEEHNNKKKNIHRAHISAIYSKCGDIYK